VLPAAVSADQLTQIVQQDLQALGYAPGNTQGEATTETVIAISRFQAENNLEVTGAATPQLAGIIKAKLKERNNPGTVASTQPAAAQPATDSAALQAAQQACIQQKVANAQASQKKKRGLGSLMRAVSRTATQMGGGSTAAAISQSTSDIYNVNATAADLESAAKDLGLTTDDLEACRNPSM
jgi:peptidoglycan hydrolase-like protein with peptidoglycan-binding domain